MIVFNVTISIFMTVKKFVTILWVEFFTKLGQNMTKFISGDLARAVFVEDLQAFEEFFIASWIWGLGDSPQMWEEIIQTNGLFGQLRFWHSIDFVTAQKVENILIGWIVTETSGQVGAFSPGDQTLTTRAIEELESVVESCNLFLSKLGCHC